MLENQKKNEKNTIYFTFKKLFKVFLYNTS